MADRFVDLLGHGRGSDRPDSDYRWWTALDPRVAAWLDDRYAAGAHHVELVGEDSDPQLWVFTEGDTSPLRGEDICGIDQTTRRALLAAWPRTLWEPTIGGARGRLVP